MRLVFPPISSSTVTATGGAINTPLVSDAIAALGVTLDPTATQQGVTARMTYYGPQHGITSPNAGGQLIQVNQAGVGLFDLEARYNITEQLQSALGGNNLFNIRPDVGGFAQAPIVAVPAGNGNVDLYPLGTAFNPNGGYYYACVSFNF